MVSRFKIKLFLVLVILTITASIMQSNHNSKVYVEPALRYIIQTGYAYDEIISVFSNQYNDEAITNDFRVDFPCEYIEIAQDYGWHVDERNHRQEFTTGLLFDVKDDSIIKSILAGEVELIEEEGGETSITIKHNEKLYSYYSGLKDVFIQIGDNIEKEQEIAKSGSRFYFELRNEEGAINPWNLLNK